MKITKSVLTVILAVILLTAQSYAFKVSGTVVNENKKPIQYAFIEALTPKFQTIAFTLSDKNGQYILDNSTYKDKAYIHVKAFGYVGEYYSKNDKKPNLSDTMDLVSDNETANFVLKDGTERVEGVQVIVWNNKLDVNFQLYPGFRDLLTQVTFTKPDGQTQTLNLKKGFVDFSTDCSKSAKWWDYEFNDETIRYGDYKLTFDFEDNYTITYTKHLKQIKDIYSADNETINLNIDDNGSVDMSWEANSNQYYRVKIKDLSGKYYFSMPAWIGLNGIHLDKSDIPCLELNKTYRWTVSTYDTFPYPPDIVVSPVNVGYQSYIEKPYSPKNLQGRVLWFGVWEWNDKLNASFNVRPGSKNNIKRAIVLAPDNSIYEFDLQNDWHDLSTDNAINREFDIFRNIEPIDGTYTLKVTFNDNYTESKTFNFEKGDDYVVPIDENSMKLSIDSYGGMLFKWKKPRDGIKQYYDVRIRNPKQTKEFFRAMVFDKNYIYVSPWELKGLAPNGKYIWLIRTWSKNYIVGTQTKPKDFEYKPTE